MTQNIASKNHRKASKIFILAACRAGTKDPISPTAKATSKPWKISGQEIKIRNEERKYAMGKC